MAGLAGAGMVSPDSPMPTDVPAREPHSSSGRSAWATREEISHGPDRVRCPRHRHQASPQPVADTVSRLTAMIEAKGMRLFAAIDQRAEARAGWDFRCGRPC